MRILVVGAGQMGTDIIVQVALMPGLRIGAIAEVRTQNAIDAALLSGRGRSDIVTASNANDIDAAIEAGKIAVTDDLYALAAAGRIDVVIDATGNPNIGTLFALQQFICKIGMSHLLSSGITRCFPSSSVALCEQNALKNNKVQAKTASHGSFKFLHCSKRFDEKCNSGKTCTDRTSLALQQIWVLEGSSTARGETGKRAQTKWITVC